MSQAENCVNLQDKTKLMFSSAASIIKSPGSSWPSYWALQAAEHGAGVAGAPSPTSKAASKCLERLRLCIIIYLQPLVCKFLEVKSTLQQPKNIDLRETPGLLNLSTEWWLYMKITCARSGSFLAFPCSTPKSLVLCLTGIDAEKKSMVPGGLVRLTRESHPKTLSSI